MGNSGDKEVLLVEYQKSQDSAQHHANMAWYSVNLTYAGSLILLGLVVNNISNITMLQLLPLAFLGIILPIVAMLTEVKFSNVEKQKYDRCKDIENELKMEQHTKLRRSRINLLVIYRILSFCFIFVWAVLLISKINCS